MVSEGDLIRPDQAEREAPREWWLEILAQGEQLSPEFLAWLDSQKRVARAIMSAPVITVSEDTEVGEIARLLVAHQIKRVPVVGDGRVIGIVAREDLLRTLVPSKPRPVMLVPDLRCRPRPITLPSPPRQPGREQTMRRKWGQKVGRLDFPRWRPL